MRSLSLQLLSPAGDGAVVRSPFDLRVEFVPRGAAKIALDTVKVQYDRQPPVDLIERVRAGLSERGIVDDPSGASARAAPQWPGMEAGVLIALPVALLLAAHYLLIIVFSDLSPMVLLAASVLLPLPFGFLVCARGIERIALWFAAAFAIALAAVLGMSAVTAVADQTTWLPQTRRDWIEFAQFSMSIGPSFCTGLILGRVFWRRLTMGHEPERRAGYAYRLVRSALGPRYGAAQAHRATVALLGAIRPATAAMAIAGSIYSGWQRFFG